MSDDDSALENAVKREELQQHWSAMVRRFVNPSKRQHRSGMVLPAIAKPANSMPEPRTTREQNRLVHKFFDVCPNAVLTGHFAANVPFPEDYVLGLEIDARHVDKLRLLRVFPSYASLNRPASAVFSSLPNDAIGFWRLHD